MKIENYKFDKSIISCIVTDQGSNFVRLLKLLKKIKKRHDENNEIRSPIDFSNEFENENIFEMSAVTNEINQINKEVQCIYRIAFISVPWVHRTLIDAIRYLSFIL